MVDLYGFVGVGWIFISLLDAWRPPLVKNGSALWVSQPAFRPHHLHQGLPRASAANRAFFLRISLFKEKAFWSARITAHRRVFPSSRMCFLLGTSCAFSS